MADQKPRLLMIVGLGHSGTTILDAALGCAPEAVGIGETLRTLYRGGSKASMAELLQNKKKGRIICSCGQPFATCPMWSSAGTVCGDQGSRDARFDAVHKSALEVKKGATIVIDSSPAGWMHLDELVGYDLSAVVLARDARSWTASRVRAGKMKTVDAYLRWRRGVLATKLELDRRGIDNLLLGYEEFALQPRKALALVCERFGLSYSDAMLAPSKHSGSHIVTGNQAIRDKARASELRYDGRWMAEARSPLLEATMFALLSKMNRRAVYSNGLV